MDEEILDKETEKKYLAVVLDEELGSIQRSWAIDFEKAFDYLEWSLIFKVLERLNFGENIQSWVKTLHKSCQLCTQ